MVNRVNHRITKLAEQSILLWIHLASASVPTNNDIRRNIIFLRESQRLLQQSLHSPRLRDSMCRRRRLSKLRAHRGNSQSAHPGLWFSRSNKKRRR